MDTQLGHEGAIKTLERTIERKTRRPIWPYVATAVAVLAVVAATLVVALDGGTPATATAWDDAKVEAFGKRQQAEPLIREATAQQPAGFVDSQVGIREGGTYAEPRPAGFVDSQVGVREGGGYAESRPAEYVDSQVGSREGGTYAPQG